MQGLIPLRMGAVNAFLLTGERGHILVDTGTPGSAERIARELERHGVKVQDIGLILITHVHADHTGSLADMKEATGARVAVHRRDAEHMARGTAPPANQESWLARRLFRTPEKPRAAGVVPDIVVDDELDLRPFGVPGSAMATPGHTPGSLSVILDSGDAVVGDLVVPALMAFGPPAIAFWASSRQQSAASIAKVLDRKPRMIYVGHGGPYRPRALGRLAAGAGKGGRP